MGPPCHWAPPQQPSLLQCSAMGVFQKWIVFGLWMSMIVPGLWGCGGGMVCGCGCAGTFWGSGSGWGVCYSVASRLSHRAVAPAGRRSGSGGRLSVKICWEGVSFEREVG